jgi:hypothetical protein
MRRVKTSKHLLSGMNIKKASILSDFILAYDKAVRFYICYLWNNKVIHRSEIKDKKTGIISERIYLLDIKNDKLDCPSFLPIAHIPYISNLSARAKNTAATQACSIVSSTLEKRNKKLYIRDKIAKNGKRTRSITKLINKEILVYPNPDIIFPELDTMCSRIEKANNISHFDSILILKSIGEKYGKIIIPFNMNKHSRKLEKKGKLLSGIAIGKDKLYLRWEQFDAEKKESGKIIGADTGINSVVTLSDSQKTPINKQGQSLSQLPPLKSGGLLLA